MRVLVAIGRLHIGGIEKYALDLIDGLINRNVTVALVVFYDIKNFEKLKTLEQKGVEVFNLRLSSGRDLKLVNKFNSVLDNFKPTIVHLNFLPLFGIFSLAFKPLSVVYTIHQMTYTPVLAWAYRHIVSGVIALSDLVYERFYHGYRMMNGSKWAVINNGVDIGEVTSRYDANSVINLLMVTRLAQDKQPNHAIEVLHYLNKTSKRTYHLYLVGEGDTNDEEYLSNLKETIRKYKLENNVFFEGWHEDVLKYFQKGHGLLLLSKKECFPYSGLESISNGVPIFSYQIEGGLHDYHKDQITGIVENSGDPMKLAERIEEVFSTPQKWEALSSSSYRCAGHYSIEGMINKTVDFYKTLA